MTARKVGKKPNLTQDKQARGRQWQGPLDDIAQAEAWAGSLHDTTPPRPASPRRQRTKIDPKPLVVPESEEMKNELTKQFKKIARQLFPNISEQRLHAIIEECFRIEADSKAMHAFLTSSRAQPDTPLLYSERPPGMKFEDFLRHEYRDKGLLTESFTLKDLRRIDPKLAAVYYQHLRRSDLPDDITIKKSRTQLNARERVALKR